MEQIKEKLRELMQASLPYDWNATGASGEGFDKHMQNQERIFDELKTLAKANKTLLGRILRFPMADSYAYYVITKVNTRTVAVEWVKYCDGWQDDRLGVRGTLPIEYAKGQIQYEDQLDRLFKKKRK